MSPMIIIIFLHCFVLTNFSCFLNYPGCGRFGRPATANSYLDEGRGRGGVVDTEDRIINGVEVTHERPWMARVIYITDRFKPIPVCGASVISRYFLLSAAHCFCNGLDGAPFTGLLDCEDANRGRRKLISGPDSARHRVLVGHLNIRDKMRLSRRVAAVVVHPNMSLETEPWSYDLALVRLSAPLAFSPKVSPICMPGRDTRELFQQVFVAGWGLMRSPDNADLDPCATNQYGPRKFAKCQDSVDNPGGKIKCLKTRPPNDPQYSG